MLLLFAFNTVDFAFIFIFLSLLVSKRLQLSGRGWPLSLSAFLLDGLYKDGAVNHLQASQC